MGSITLRWVSSNDIISRIIRGAELGSPFQHVEALMPDGTLLGAHWDGGVQARDRNYDQGQYVKDLIVTVPCSSEQQTAFETFLRAQIGKPYDREAIAELADGALTGEYPSWPTSDSWICSGLITAALLTAKLVFAAPATVRLTNPTQVLYFISAITPLPAPSSAT